MPADLAGIRPGDVLVRWKGMPLDGVSAQRFEELVQKTPMGDRVRVELKRGGQIQQVELLIAGQVIEGRVKPVGGSPGRFSIYRMEQTTPDSPSAARITARWVGPKPGPTEIRIRPRHTGK